MGALMMNFSGIELSLDGLPQSFSSKLSTDWAPFVAERIGTPLLRVHVEIQDPNALVSPFAPQTLASVVKGAGGEFRLPGGNAVLSADGEAHVRLHSASRESHFNLVNLLLACLAVRLPTRGAMLLHAACLVVAGRAHLLVGSSGAGKSTWARLGIEAGAQAIGDDLVLVDGTEALGSPFRSRHLDGFAVPGRWPIAGLFFPRHGKTASRTPASRLLAQARLTGNLPFLTESAGRDAVTGSMLDGLLEAVPCYDLTFARDTSFMPLLNASQDE